MSGLERRRADKPNPEGGDKREKLSVQQELLTEIDRVLFGVDDPEKIERTVSYPNEDTELTVTKMGPHGPRAVEILRQPTGDNGGFYKRKGQQFVWSGHESDILAFDVTTAVVRDKPPRIWKKVKRTHSQQRAYTPQDHAEVMGRLGELRMLNSPEDLQHMVGKIHDKAGAESYHSQSNVVTESETQLSDGTMLRAHRLVAENGIETHRIQHMTVHEETPHSRRVSLHNLFTFEGELFTIQYDAWQRHDESGAWVDSRESTVKATGPYRVEHDRQLYSVLKEALEDTE